VWFRTEFVMIFDFFFTSALTILNETSVAFLSCSALLPNLLWLWLFPSHYLLVLTRCIIRHSTRSGVIKDTYHSDFIPTIQAFACSSSSVRLLVLAYPSNALHLWYLASTGSPVAMSCCLLFLLHILFNPCLYNLYFGNTDVFWCTDFIMIFDIVHIPVP